MNELEIIQAFLRFVTGGQPLPVYLWRGDRAVPIVAVHRVPTTTGIDILLLDPGDFPREKWAPDVEMSTDWLEVVDNE